LADEFDPVVAQEGARAEQHLQEQLRSGAESGGALAAALEAALEAGAGWDALQAAWAAKTAMEMQARRNSGNSARASSGSGVSAQTAAAAGPLQDEVSRLDASCAAVSRLDTSCAAVSRPMSRRSLCWAEAAMMMHVFDLRAALLNRRCASESAQASSRFQLLSIF